MQNIVLLALVALFSSFAYAGDIAYPSYPIAVKNPYLQGWLPGYQFAPSGQTQFWTGTNLTWAVMARVEQSDGTSQTYTLFGFPDPPPNTVIATQVGNIEVTATHTYYTVNCGAAHFKLDFFSVIDPNDYVVHSLPYSYLTITASSNQSATIDVYSSLDDSWTGMKGSNTYDFSTYQSTSLFQVNNTNAIPFTEDPDTQMALYGTFVFATQSSGSGKPVIHNIGTPANLHTCFIKNGTLCSSNDASPQPSNGNIVGFVHPLGKVSGSRKVQFAIGLDRGDKAVNYHNVTQSGYYRSKYPDIPPAVDFFLNNYGSAKKKSKSIDRMVKTKSAALSKNYTDVVELSVRQAFGPLEVLIPSDTLSTADNDTNIFLKEVSSDGNVNSVDVIFPTFPIMYFLAPDWITGLLQPVLEYMANYPWDENFVVHDLGYYYPNATGHDGGEMNEDGTLRPEYMPLEVTSMMLIMLAAHAQATGSNSFAKKYYGPRTSQLLTTFADYLVDKGLFPENQLATVDAIPATANQTQLAIISTIGIGAMGQMAGMKNYTKAAKRFANQIQNNATLGAFDANKTHFTYSYGQDDTWNVMFPLFADALLGLDLFNSSYSIQSDWYEQNIDEYGLPYANGINWGVTDWNFWGATTSSGNVMTQVIDTTVKYLTDRLSIHPFGTKYNVTNPGAGNWLQNIARSTVGANFAPIILQEAQGMFSVS